MLIFDEVSVQKPVASALASWANKSIGAVVPSLHAIAGVAVPLFGCKLRVMASVCIAPQIELGVV